MTRPKEPAIKHCKFCGLPIKTWRHEGQPTQWVHVAPVWATCPGKTAPLPMTAKK